MSEHDWTTTPAPQTTPDVIHKATIEGLRVEITERPEVKGGYARWMVMGYLADISVYASPGSPLAAYRVTVEQAKAAALAAVKRLRAAGVRGEIGYPVACCDRLFTTRDAADQHETEYGAEQVAGEDAQREAAASEGETGDVEDDEIRIGRLPRDDEEGA